MPKNPTITAFLGIRNTLDVRRMPEGALAEAVNVDIDDTGEVMRRGGYAVDADLAATAITAAYTDTAQEYTYVVDDGSLARIDGNKVRRVLATGLADTMAYWAELGSRVVCSLGKYIHTEGDGAAYGWRIETPPTPTCFATAGDFFAGQYQVVTTYLSEDGREGPSSDAHVVDLDADSGLVVQASGTLTERVYMTDVDGTEFFYAGDAPLTIQSRDALTRTRIDPDLLLASPPPDDIGPIAIHDGSLYAASYDRASDMSYVWASKPYRWHVFDLYQSAIGIPGEVRMMFSAGGSLCIGTDKQLLAYGGESLATLAEYGVPKGQQHVSDRDGTAYFWTARGLCKAMPFENLTDGKVSLPPGDWCSVYLVEQDGMKRVIVLTDGAGVANNARQIR